MLFKFISIISFLFMLFITSLAAHPLTHQQLKQYYESGTYFKEIENKLLYAQGYLQRQVEHASSKPLAIILDIDETALSNYEDLSRLHFTHNIQATTAAMMLGGAQPLKPVLTLYQYAIAHGVHVFFISERPHTPEMMAVTVQNLKSAGFTEWEELILMPIDTSKPSIASFKTEARKRISLKGYDILLNIGDEDHDIQGGFAEVKVKLPNPFY